MSKGIILVIAEGLRIRWRKEDSQDKMEERR
jgi:hypothetical protein